MALVILKHMASLTRHINRFSMRFTSSAATSHSCLRILSAAPSALLWTTGIHTTQPHPSLLGQCQALSCIQPTAGMKTKSALKRRCKDCFFVRRRGRLFVFCKTHPRHKQRQG
uniref:Ribosomal protein n=1 Tax=Neogobius melanostomus TaxID=47308 RepID=A0A8C6S230_9GOBI